MDYLGWKADETRLQFSAELNLKSKTDTNYWEFLPSPVQSSQPSCDVSAHFSFP